MELPKPGETTNLPSYLAPSEQLSSSDDRRPLVTSVDYRIAPNRTNNTSPASVSDRQSQQLSSSNNELHFYTTADYRIDPNRTNNTSPASVSNRPHRILLPWEVKQNSNTNPPRTNINPLKPNTLNKSLPQMEVSPKPTAAKGASKASNKRPIQQVEVSPKAQSSTGIESVRSKLRKSIMEALSISTGGETSEDNPQPNEEEKMNQRKEEGQNDCDSMVDELLQENGLYWAENFQNALDVNMLEDEKCAATKIEVELFRLFGGVNKKYEEKGRSLLFSLKDVSNSELRVGVLSGDIKPEKLCLMSAEEIASREFSERQGKAHKMAQAIGLLDEDVGMRKRVKKTHKREFVMIEEEKGSSWVPHEVKIKAGANVETSTRRVEQHVKDAKNEDDAPDLLSEMLAKGEFENGGHLFPTVSLDEFMKDLHSDPPFTNFGISNSEEAVAQADALEQTKSFIKKEDRSTK